MLRWGFDYFDDSVALYSTNDEHCYHGDSGRGGMDVIAVFPATSSYGKDWVDLVLKLTKPVRNPRAIHIPLSAQLLSHAQFTGLPDEDPDGMHGRLANVSAIAQLILLRRPLDTGDYAMPGLCFANMGFESGAAFWVTPSNFVDLGARGEARGEIGPIYDMPTYPLPISARGNLVEIGAELPPSTDYDDMDIYGVMVHIGLGIGPMLPSPVVASMFDGTLSLVDVMESFGRQRPFIVTDKFKVIWP